MINTYDVKDSMRKSDVIFYSLNGLHGRKISGTLGKNEFSDTLITIGDIFANLIKKGKISDEVIESYESHVTQLLGENRDKYFTHQHDGLERAGKANLEGIYFAKEEQEKRNAYAQPVMDAESYERTFKKLG